MTTPTGTEAAVCQDIAERQQMGIAKYGTTVADNPLSLREWLNHAYQETLDKAVYLKRAIAEIDQSQQYALSEARLRIVARCDQLEKMPIELQGSLQGLKEARRIIGAMWDDLPISKPQAVIDHEQKAHTRH